LYTHNKKKPKQAAEKMNILYDLEDIMTQKNELLESPRKTYCDFYQQVGQLQCLPGACGQEQRGIVNEGDRSI